MRPDANGTLFRYAGGRGHKRADMYDLAVFDETIAKSGREFMFGINEHPPGVGHHPGDNRRDQIRAALSLQSDRLEVVGLTDTYLGFS